MKKKQQQKELGIQLSVKVSESMMARIDAILARDELVSRANLYRHLLDEGLRLYERQQRRGGGAS